MTIIGFHPERTLLELFLIVRSVPKEGRNHNWTAFYEGQKNLPALNEKKALTEEAACYCIRRYHHSLHRSLFFLLLLHFCQSKSNVNLAILSVNSYTDSFGTCQSCHPSAVHVFEYIIRFHLLQLWIRSI